MNPHNNNMYVGYCRYLESLNEPAPLPTVSRWDRYLGASAQNTRPHPAAPFQDRFFYRSAAPYTNKEELNQALWNLRNHMVQDALQLHRFLGGNELL